MDVSVSCANCAEQHRDDLVVSALLSNFDVAVSRSVELESQALVALAAFLKNNGYSFTTITPATQARVNARTENSHAVDLSGIFGWSRDFRRDRLPPGLFALMQEANIVVGADDRYRSAVRVSTLGPLNFIHSAYPTTAADAVFFGPDTVRFTDAIGRQLKKTKRPSRVADIGCGAGTGGIVVAANVPDAEIVAIDINPTALRYAEINAAVNNVSIQVALSDVFSAVSGTFDLIISNPPYLRDPNERAYRHGGGQFGEGLSLRILQESLDQLAENGTLLLYTGSAIVNGRDLFKAQCQRVLDAAQLPWTYIEVDPDVFGEELEMPAYAQVDRIAAVVLTVTK